jgi:hypothetical protein
LCPNLSLTLIGRWSLSAPPVNLFAS